MDRHSLPSLSLSVFIPLTRVRTTMEQSLAEIASLSSTSKAQAYIALLDRTIASSSNSSEAAIVDSLDTFVSAVVQDSVGLVTSRQVISALVRHLQQQSSSSSTTTTDKHAAALPLSTEIRQRIAGATLDALQARQASFEEQVSKDKTDGLSLKAEIQEIDSEVGSMQIVALRELLADMLEADEEWTDAAKMLQGIPLEASSNRWAKQRRMNSSLMRVPTILTYW